MSVYATEAEINRARFTSSSDGLSLNSRPHKYICLYVYLYIFPGYWDEDVCVIIELQKLSAVQTSAGLISLISFLFADRGNFLKR